MDSPEIDQGRNGLRNRWWILFLLFSGTFVTAIDRGSLGGASTTIMKEMNLNPKQMGYILAAFGWGYAALIVPAGALADRFGAKGTLGWFALTWSLASALSGAAMNRSQLVLCRIGVGFGEAAVNPVNTMIVKSRFPSSLRGTAVGIYLSAFRLGLAVAPVLMAWLIVRTSWRKAFYLTGAGSALWVGLWYFTFTEKREPANSRRLLPRVPWRLLLKHRNIQGLVLCKFFQDYAYYFFVTWLPAYLAMERGFGLMKSGLFASLPFLAAFLSQPLAGMASDWLIKCGWSRTAARKGPIVVLQLVAAVVVAAGYADSAILAMWLLSLSLACESAASAVLAAACAEVAPLGAAASASGLMNGAGALAACVCPIVTGELVYRSGNFHSALWAGGVMLLLGAFSMWFVVGTIDPIEFPAAETGAAAA